MKNEYYVPFFNIKVNGSSIEMEYRKCISSVNLSFDSENTDMCTISLEGVKSSWIDGQNEIFAEGNEVSIDYGYYKQNNESSFLGEIYSLEPQFSSSGMISLTARVYDLSHRLKSSINKKDPYIKVKDSDIAKIIANRNNLESEIDISDDVFEKVYQKSKSDFQFLTERAKNIGYDFYVENKTLYFKKNENNSKTIINLSWKENLIDFNPRINSASVKAEIEVRGWSAKQKKEISAKKTLDTSLLKEVLSDQAIKRIKSNSKNKQHKNIDQLIRSQREAEIKADSLAKDNVNQILTASGNCIGMPLLKPGVYLEIQGLAERFNGEYYVKSSSHSFGSGAYTTNFNVERRLL